MKRLISILVLLIIIIGIAVMEEIFIHNFITNLTVKAEIVSVEIEKNKDNLNNESISSVYSDLKSFWKKSKIGLCYFTNYEKIKTIDESFVKLSTALKNNDLSLATENIAVVKEYGDFFHYMMGFNLNNLF